VFTTLRWIATSPARWGDDAGSFTLHSNQRARSARSTSNRFQISSSLTQSLAKLLRAGKGSALPMSTDSDLVNLEMKNPFQTAPRCVQWAAVILIAVQVFSIVVGLKIAPAARYLPFSGVLLPSIALQLTFAGGLLFGMNLVRLLFAATYLYGVTTMLIFWSQQGGVSSMSLFNDLPALFAPALSLVLVFLPPANRYFAGKAQPEPKMEKVEKEKLLAFWPIARIVVLIFLLVVGLPLVRRYRPVFENATSMNKQQKADYAQYQRDLQDIQIVENLRMLDQAQNQYFYEHAVTSAKYSDLVGPDHFIYLLTTSAAGEKYPDEFISG